MQPLYKVADYNETPHPTCPVWGTVEIISYIKDVWKESEQICFEMGENGVAQNIQDLGM